MLHNGAYGFDSPPYLAYLLNGTTYYKQIKTIFLPSCQNWHIAVFTTPIDVSDNLLSKLPVLPNEIPDDTVSGNISLRSLIWLLGRSAKMVNEKPVLNVI